VAVLSKKGGFDVDWVLCNAIVRVQSNLVISIFFISIFGL
jgi:hypothetical protein